MQQDHILIHYGEIALKGKNRSFFETRLIQNIKSQLEAFAPGCIDDVKKISGSILMKLNANGIRNKEKVSVALLHTFGISNFSFAASVKQDIDEIKNVCWNMVKGENFKTFRIETRRSNKDFMDSQSINKTVGAHIFEKFRGTKFVNLKNADCECHINIVEKYAFVSLEKIQGLGGMPAQTQGRTLVLMSGGFDSPIAAWQVSKRGATTFFAHFHSMPYTSKSSVEKVKNLIRVLQKFGSSGDLFLIPFADVQKEIMLKAPSSLRVILYRRFMVRIAEALARKERCLALVTGDSIGQVASQTLENIFAVNEAATLPIFRPLIGDDKEEIMQKARAIGTYDISKLPHDDCCTRLMPKNPEIHAKLQDVLEAEKAFDVEKLIGETLAKTEKVILK